MCPNTLKVHHTLGAENTPALSYTTKGVSGPATPSESAAAAKAAADGSMCGRSVPLSHTPATSKKRERGILGPRRNSSRPSRPTFGMNQLASSTMTASLFAWSRSARAPAEMAAGRWAGSTTGEEEDEGCAMATTTTV